MLSLVNLRGYTLIVRVKMVGSKWSGQICRVKSRVNCRVISRIQCSTLTIVDRQGITCEKKEDLFKWCRTKLKVEIIHEGSTISMMKTVARKIVTSVRRKGSTCFTISVIEKDAKPWLIADQNCLVFAHARRSFYGYVPLGMWVLMKLLASQK